MKALLAFSMLPLAGMALADAGGGHDMQQMWQKSLARAPLAVGVAFAPDGRLWRADVRQGVIELAASDDFGQRFAAPVKVNATAEAIAADGENRPQLVFGPQGEIGVGWTQSLPQPFSGHARFSWSRDGGKSWSTPQTINDDAAPISHRFVVLDWSCKGLIAVWLDARDKTAAKAKKHDYRGSALYSAAFDPASGRFGANRKLADYSCECCRVALAHDPDGTPVALWRHVFPGNIRDHALQRLDGASPLQRVSFDQWQIDACPHHGPSLSIAGNGTRHLVWFNQGRAPQMLFYGRMAAGSDKPADVVGIGNPDAQAAHPAVLAAEQRVLLAWKEFDGKQSAIRVQQSTDGGKSWSAPRTALEGAGQSDHPQLLRWQQRVFLIWNMAEGGLKVVELSPLSAEH